MKVNLTYDSIQSDKKKGLIFYSNFHGYQKVINTYIDKEKNLLVVKSFRFNRTNRYNHKIIIKQKQLSIFDLL